MKTIKILLLVLFSLRLLSVKAQEEFLATVNPTTGVHTIIDSIPGVHYILYGTAAYDKNNKRYFFKGEDFGGQWHLYCVNAITGSIISSPACTLNVAAFEYDNGSNQLFALELNSAIGKMFLVALNIATANRTIIDTLPFIGVTDGSTCFDELNGRYIISYGGSLYSINAVNGSINSVPVSPAFNEFFFDNTTGFAYAISMGPPMSLARINPATGSSTTVCTFTFSSITSGRQSFSEVNQIYTFGDPNRLYSVAVNTGSIVADPIFPVGITSPENVIELRYDNQNGKLFALHWGAVVATGINTYVEIDNLDFKIIPNPATSQTSIYLDKAVQTINISVIDLFGRAIKTQHDQNVEVVDLNLNGISKGIYFIAIEADEKHPVLRKIIIE